MISYLIGIPILRNTTLTLLVGGVGYKVIVGPKTLQKVSTKKETALHIFTHVKENILDLYGFENPEELDLFKLVLGISGVGPAIALALANSGTEKLIESVQNANVTFFSSIPRVGKKLAQKIIIELKPKLGSLKELNLAPLSSQDQDISDALHALGFDDEYVEQALENLAKNGATLDLPQSIQFAIKSLGKNQ